MTVWYTGLNDDQGIAAAPNVLCGEGGTRWLATVGN